MITEMDLYRLGYRIKMRLTDTDRSIDFKHEDFENRSYLINLRKGGIHIVYPTNKSMKKPFFSTSDINELRNWHNNFKQ